MLLLLAGVGSAVVEPPVVLLNVGVPFANVGTTIANPPGPMAGGAARIAVGTGQTLTAVLVVAESLRALSSVVVILIVFAEVALASPAVMLMLLPVAGETMPLSSTAQP